jgi:hypothetical protein
VISRSLKSQWKEGLLKSQSLQAHQSFGKLGFENQGNKLLDIATVENVIRRNPNREGKGQR